MIEFGLNVSNDFSKVDIQPCCFSRFDDAQSEIRAMPARTWIFLSSPPIHENRDRSTLFFRLAALRNITDELFVFVVGSSALQRHITTKEEKHFTLAINNNQSVRSMCLVTDIPYFLLFIFLSLFSLSSFRICLYPARSGDRCWTRINLRSINSAQLLLKKNSAIQWFFFNMQIDIKI